METKFYNRNTFRVEAVQITEKNISEIAEWVGTEVQFDKVRYGDRPFIFIPIGKKYDKPHYGPALPGDWLTKNNESGWFQRYRNEKFGSMFREYNPDADEATREEIRKKEMEKVLHEFLIDLMGEPSFANGVVEKHVRSAAVKAIRV